MDEQRQDDQLEPMYNNLCVDTGVSLEDLPEPMDNRDGWWESVRESHAGGTWWWLFLLQGSLWYLITHKGWYTIKQRNQTRLKRISLEMTNMTVEEYCTWPINILQISYPKWKSFRLSRNPIWILLSWTYFADFSHFKVTKIAWYEKPNWKIFKRGFKKKSKVTRSQ